MNKKKEIELSIDENFKTFFEENGYRRKRILEYYRHQEDIEYRIGFAVTKKKYGGYEITTGVGLILVEIEKIFVNKEFEFRFGKPIHLLRESKEYRYWTIEEAGEIRNIRIEIMEDFQRYAFSFFTEYKNSSDVIKMLQTPDPKNWFMCTPDRRDSVLVIWEYLKNGKDAALNEGEKLIKKYEDKRPAFYQQLDEAIDKIRKLK